MRKLLRVSSVCLFAVLIILACKHENKQHINAHPVRVVATLGLTVPKDSTQEPAVVLAGEPTKVKAGMQKAIPFGTKVAVIHHPKSILAGIPIVRVPGVDTLRLPIKTQVAEHPSLAGCPEVSVAKDMTCKDHNPQNFSTFGKLQGLKHNSVRCLLQDRIGNMWFGTLGGGATKYDGRSFTSFTKKEGLANNLVWCMLQDKSGNIWFGTDGGISKYDGRSFSTFTEKDGIPNNTVSSILEDKQGNIWFGTYGGACKFDGKYFCTFTTKQGLANDVVVSMLEDKVGNIWLGTYDGGVSKYDGKSFSNYSDKEGLANNVIISLLQDKKGNLWFGTYQGGVSKFDGTSFTTFTEKNGLANNTVFALSEDKSGNIWFGTEGGGISKYDGESFYTYSEAEGLVNNSVSCVLEDKSGNLWFGSSGGVSKYSGNTFNTFTEQEGLANNTVWSILQDKKGKIWFGTYGGGLSIFDGSSFSTLSDKEGLANNFILSALEDKRGNLWFGTSCGLSKYDGKTFTNFTDQQGLPNNTIWAILEDKRGNIWLDTYSGGVTKFDGKSFSIFTTKEGLVNNTVLSMLEDKQGNLWFGTDGGGVSKYNGKTFISFREEEGLANNTVSSIMEDKDGNLWFGTNEGVSMYDGKSFITITDQEGLVNNIVVSVLQDHGGNIWFATRFGISKLTPKKFNELMANVRSKSIKEDDVFFKNFSYEDGFLGIGCYARSIFEAADGAIWIGTNGMLTKVRPEGMISNTIAPNIQLTGIELFNENISWVKLDNNMDTTVHLRNGVAVSGFEFEGLSKWYALPEHLSLSHTNNYLTFNFVGVTMSQPRQVKYQYKLEGIDENWSGLTNKTSAPYGNLPHGTYTFKVKCMTSEGFWSEPFLYQFTIRPPWWKTWWFRTLVFLLVIFSVWFYIKWRERSLQEDKKRLEVTVAERTEELVKKNLIVEEQKHLVEEKHKEITDSINYAERIQRALLASKKLLDQNLTFRTEGSEANYFILFKPKDIVSGDFYWANKLSNGNFVLVTADSTGHGVPGAIMSILNMACLKEAVIQGIQRPDLILNETRRLIIESLANDGSREGGKDGMDASAIAFDFKKKILYGACAYNPVWLIREKKIIEIEADRMPVGKHENDQTPFSLHTLEIQKGDLIYTFTDGFADQFGGPKLKKFMYKRLKEVLIANSQASLIRQKEILELEFNSWKGDLEQVDDVCIIGVRV